MSAINQPEMHIFALTQREIIVAKGKEEFSKALREILYSDLKWHFSQMPYSGIEVSRFLGEEREEAIYAGKMMRRLVTISLNVAEGWLANCPLSNRAYQRATTVLNRWKTVNGIELSPFEIGTIRLGETGGTYCQGAMFRKLRNGEIVIRVEGRLLQGTSVNATMVPKKPVQKKTAISFGGHSLRV